MVGKRPMYRYGRSDGRNRMIYNIDSLDNQSNITLKYIPPCPNNFIRKDRRIFRKTIEYSYFSHNWMQTIERYPNPINVHIILMVRREKL